MRATLLLFLQMLGTINLLVLFPAETPTQFTYAPTLEGQYILKNIMLVSAAIVFGATMRGFAIIAHRDATRTALQIENSSIRGCALRNARPQHPHTGLGPNL